MFITHIRNVTMIYFITCVDYFIWAAVMFRLEKATWGKATPAQPSPPRLSFDIKIWGPSRYSQAPPLVTFRIRHWVGATVIWLEHPPLNPNYVELEQKPRSREGPSSLALIGHGYPEKKNTSAHHRSWPASESIPDIHHVVLAKPFNYCNEFSAWL